MGFRRAKSTQGNTNCQKNIFEDDQVPGHHPRAFKLKVQTLKCLEVETGSVLLFSGVPLSIVMEWNFSVRQRSHCFEVFEYLLVLPRYPISR